MVWYGMVWRGVVWCGVVWCNVVQCGVVWCDSSKKYYSAVPHENSAFKNFACASLILDCEHISSI